MKYLFTFRLFVTVAVLCGCSQKPDPRDAKIAELEKRLAKVEGDFNAAETAFVNLAATLKKQSESFVEEMNAVTEQLRDPDFGKPFEEPIVIPEELKKRIAKNGIYIQGEVFQQKTNYTSIQCNPFGLDNISENKIEIIDGVRIQRGFCDLLDADPKEFPFDKKMIVVGFSPEFATVTNSLGRPFGIHRYKHFQILK